MLALASHCLYNHETRQDPCFEVHDVDTGCGAVGEYGLCIALWLTLSDQLEQKSNRQRRSSLLFRATREAERRAWGRLQTEGHTVGLGLGLSW